MLINRNDLGAVCAKVILLFPFPETDHWKTANTPLGVRDGLPKSASTEYAALALC